jgi:hypothetical protein
METSSKSFERRQFNNATTEIQSIPARVSIQSVKSRKWTLRYRQRPVCNLLCFRAPGLLYVFVVLNRRQVRIYRSHAEADDGGYMPGTPEERLSQVWELTKDAWAFFRGIDAQRRLQRDAAVLIRGKS